MSIKHTAKLETYECQEWYENHPQSPGEGHIPIMEVILWQTPDESGIIRTYNFNHAYCETREQYKAMGEAMFGLLDNIIKTMEQIGIIHKMSDEEKRIAKAKITGQGLH